MAINLALQRRQELTEVSLYISELPPEEIWSIVAEVIDSDDVTDIRQHWYWLGLHLKHFFNDESDLLPDAEQSKEWNLTLKTWGNYYIQLSNMIFQAKKFLILEAKKQGKDYPFERRSDLLKRLATEHCLSYILPYLEDCWQSPSEAQQRDAIRDYVLARQLNRLSQYQASARAERWKAAQSSRYEGMRYLPVTTWNSFCSKVFDEHKKDLPGYSAYLEAIKKLGKLPTMKYSIHNGKMNTYPGRGKGKTSKKS